MVATARDDIRARKLVAELDIDAMLETRHPLGVVRFVARTVYGSEFLLVPATRRGARLAAG
jgi:hypothetical protein